MKITILKYISFLLIFVSCTSHKTISNHWLKYVESNFSSNNLSASKNTALAEPKLKLTKPLFFPQDSVKILTKSGTTYEGRITKSDFNGYYIKINNNNEIYVSNSEIKEITFLNPNNTVLSKTSSDSVNKKANIIPKTKNESQIKNENIWDRTNSDFINKSSPKQVKSSSYKKNMAPFSILSFVSTVLGFFTGFTFLLGLIFGAISLSKIKKNPEKYKGRGLAIFSFIFSLVMTFIVMLLIVLLLFWVL
jgi:uncharacterized membrane protein